MSSSPGYPWKKWFKNKRDALAYPIIRTRVYEGQCWTKPRPMWDLFGKFEILPVEKSLSRCRAITSCPVDVALVVATWYEEQNETLMNLCYSTPYGVGMRKMGGGWNRVLSRFISDKVWQCDVSQYDSCIRPNMLKSVYNVRKNLFHKVSDEYLQFEEEWLNFLIEGDIRLTNNGNFYNVVGGNKSGSPNTSSDNTIANMLLVCFSLIMSGQNPYLTNFVCYGDDMLIDGSVHEDTFDYYARCGMMIKLGSLRLVDLLDADFLSCHSIIRYNQYLPVWNPKKAAYSMLTTDSKRELRDKQRLKSLLIESLWCDDYPLLEEYAKLKECSISRNLLEDIFFGKEVGGTKKNDEEESTKTKKASWKDATTGSTACTKITYSFET